ncbi:MAG: restriction endonuclease [Candidatus Bathyarchaeia archaeon]
MNTEEQKETKSSTNLLNLAIKYLKKEGYKIEQEKTVLEGRTGVLRKFDLIVQKGRTAQGVWVKDWNRTIGINVVINLDKASEDADLSNPILIGENFSDHAKAYANRRKVTLLTKKQILTSLR